MSSEKSDRITQVLAEPLDTVLVNLAEGIAQAQRLLDESAIATQLLLDSDPELNQYGLEATWYHIPETQLELKLAVSLLGEVRTQDIEGKQLHYTRLRAVVAPLNATYVNTFNYDVSGACTIHAKVVAIPAQMKRRTQEA